MEKESLLIVASMSDVVDWLIGVIHVAATHLHSLRMGCIFICGCPLRV